MYILIHKLCILPQRHMNYPIMSSIQHHSFIDHLLEFDFSREFGFESEFSSGCGGDIGNLTLGVARAQTMVGAKAAQRHGRPTKTRIILSHGTFRMYVENGTK